MTQWLCIHLAGPMASFGETAGNTERGTADRPTRSAMLGLAGAALGIDRHDSDAQTKLSHSLSTSCKTVSPGTLLVDFHTYQSVPRSKTFYQTRKQALASGNANTSITRREYRSGGHWQLAYELKEGATISLETLKAAFEKPVYTLWIGRKSCPPGFPLLAEIIEAESLEKAFQRHMENCNCPSVEARLVANAVIATDDHRHAGPQNGVLRHNRRNDEPVNRTSWTFETRDEYEFMTGS